MHCFAQKFKEMGPILEFCNGLFEPRRWLFYMRYEAMVRGMQNRPIAYPLFKGVGVLLARMDFKWKKSGLIQYNCKSCQKNLKIKY